MIDHDQKSAKTIHPKRHETFLIVIAIFNRNGALITENAFNIS